VKFDTVKVVTREAFLEHLVGIVESNHTKSKNGSKRGGIRTTAGLYGVHPTEISNVLAGVLRPTKKLLEHEGLEAVTVYVRKEKRDA